MEDSEVMKVALLGESGVGKTCILDRYVKNTFNDTTTTEHAKFKSKIFTAPDNITKIRQVIWDTAGQEVYRSLANFYYKDADGIILVYDITNEVSFNELTYWINEVRNNVGKDVLLTIAANKSDKIDEEKVTVDIGRNFAESHGASFFLVSAKENINIAEMFIEMGSRKFSKLMKANNSKNDVRKKSDCDKKSDTNKQTTKTITKKLKKGNTEKHNDNCC